MAKQQTTSDNEPEEMGPKMQALTPKQRLFIRAMLSDPGGFQGNWAAAAGYSTKSNSHDVAACRMMQDPRIIAAAQEVARQHLSGNGPALGVKNLLRIASDQKHPKNYDASLAILNRCGMSEKVEVRVEHSVDGRDMLELCRRMATEMKIPLEMLWGANRLDGEARAPKLIEASAVEVKPEPEAVQPEYSNLNPE